MLYDAFRNIPVFVHISAQGDNDKKQLSTSGKYLQLENLYLARLSSVDYLVE